MLGLAFNGFLRELEIRGNLIDREYWGQFIHLAHSGSLFWTAGATRQHSQLNNTSFAYSVSTYSRTVWILSFFTSNTTL